MYFYVCLLQIFAPTSECRDLLHPKCGEMCMQKPHLWLQAEGNNSRRGFKVSLFN